MKESKKVTSWKLRIVSLLVAVLVVAGVAVYKTNTKPVEGQKSFTISIQSERDSFEKTIDCKTTDGTLGEYVRTLDECIWEDSEYGTYITGWYSYEQDLSNQYWWSIGIDGEMSPNGADMIVLEEGRDYEFTLIQGW